MALQPIITGQDNENPDIAGQKALQRLQPPSSMGGGSLGPLPRLPDTSSFNTGLKPIVISPRQQQEQALQQRISDFEAKQNGPSPTGFWGKLGHAIGQSGLGQMRGSVIRANQQQEGRVKELAGLQGEDRQDTQVAQQGANLASEESLRSSQGREAEARANALENPQDKPDKFTFQDTDHGLMRIDNTTGEASPVTYQGSPLSKSKADKAPTGAEDDQKYEDIVARHLEGKSVSPEDTAFAKAYRDRKTLGQQVTNVYANQREGNKADAQTRQASYKAFTPALDSAERFNVMAKNYEDAVGPEHNQQAMLSLLANHLGMTMGLQKGARMTKDIIREAQQSTPWLQGIAAKFGPDGYLSGVTLTPEQMRQMVDLAHERFGEDVNKSRSEARYLGANDDGPEREPSKSVIRYYLSQAGGDPEKGKQLAREAGWSVK